MALKLALAVEEVGSGIEEVKGVKVSKDTPLFLAKHSLAKTLDVYYNALTPDATVGFFEKLDDATRKFVAAQSSMATSYANDEPGEKDLAVAEAKKHYYRVVGEVLKPLRERSNEEYVVQMQMKEAFQDTVKNLARTVIKASGMLWNSEQHDVLHWFLENQLSEVTHLYKDRFKTSFQPFGHVDPMPVEQRGSARSKEELNDPHLQGRLTKVLGQRTATLLLGELKDLPYQYVDGELLLNHKRELTLTLGWLKENDPSFGKPRQLTLVR